MILSTTISVSVRRSTADRSSHASDGQLRHGRLAGEPVVLPIELIMCCVDLRRHLSKRLGYGFSNAATSSWHAPLHPSAAAVRRVDLSA